MASDFTREAVTPVVDNSIRGGVREFKAMQAQSAQPVYDNCNELTSLRDDSAPRIRTVGKELALLQPPYFCR